MSSTAADSFNFDVSIISKKLATVGVSAEAGVYANLYGFFLYELKYAEGEDGELTDPEEPCSGDGGTEPAGSVQEDEPAAGQSGTQTTLLSALRKYMLAPSVIRELAL